MIPDEFQFSIRHPNTTLFDDDLLTIFEEDLANSNMKLRSSASSGSSSPIPYQTINTIKSDCSEEKSNADKLINENNSISKRKFFTKEEDNLLTMAALSFGSESWNSIAQYVPGKTPKQCRDRWTNYLHPSLNFQPWSDQEDQLLVNLVNSHGTHWSKMRQFFPDRSTNSIKNRWYWLIKNQIKVISIDKIINTSSKGIQRNQAQIQSDFNESSNNLFTQNNIYRNNPNINPNMNNNNDDLANSSLYSSKNENNQKCFYILKNKSKKKNTYKEPKKTNPYFQNIPNNQTNEKTNLNYSKNQQNDSIFNSEELISFKPEELDW
ncbi:hypothetical protein M9Y10_004054 [Tritrichomonas musculus]|uniref:Myb-like DNA-binding domain containing protein n=1 Tax=Tritrichomonas musculus TaxID=1915356 RepID=A0ABR2JRJ4_9EUKA